MKPQDPLDTLDDVTRRQWLLRLGEMIALAGISGVVPETPILLFGAQQEDAALPPGLYGPSTDDLVHALSAHQGSAPPAGSETDYAQPASIPFRPQFFTDDEFRVVTRFAEVILGNVEPDAFAQTTRWIDLWFQSSDGVRRAAQQLDPLHRALGVAFFGEAAVRELENANPANAAHEGLAALRKLCREEHKKDFSELSSSEQTELVRSVSAADPNSQPRRFYDLIRRETVRGYYTTAAGLKELDYKGNAYYTECPGCDSSREQSPNPAI